MRTEEEMLAIVHGKAAAIRRRRRTVVLGVTAATVVLIGIVTIANNPSSTRDRVQVADSRTSTRPNTTSTASDSSDQGLSLSSGSTSDSSASFDSAPPTNADEPTGSLEPASSDEPSSTDHPVRGLTVEVSPNPTAGEVVFVTLHVANRRPDDGVGLKRETTGPGWWEPPPGANPAFGTPCSSERDVPRSDGSYVFQTAFRLPGRHTLLAGIFRCSGSPEPDVTVTVNIDVSGPVGPSNGPFVPQFLFGPVGLEPSDGDDPTATYVELLIQDMDGVLDHLLIDWGDGTPPELVPIVFDPSYNERACDATQEYADTVDVRQSPHHYVVKKSYTVTVTAYSVGCNGEAPHQQASASATIEAV